MLFTVVFARLLQAVATFAVAYESLRNEPRTGRLMAAAIALALVIAAEPFLQVWNERRQRRAEFRQQDVQAILGTALAAVQDTTAMRPGAVGVQFFALRRDYLFRPFLKRVGRLRLDDTHPPTPVVWRKGLGVIGTCWSLNQFTIFEIDPANLGVVGAAGTITDGAHAGLDGRLAAAMAERFGVIAAHVVPKPMTGAFLGVLSIDGEPGSFNNINSGAVRRVISSAAMRVGEAVSR